MAGWADWLAKQRARRHGNGFFFQTPRRNGLLLKDRTHGKFRRRRMETGYIDPGEWKKRICRERISLAASRSFARAHVESVFTLITFPQVTGCERGRRKGS